MAQQPGDSSSSIRTRCGRANPWAAKALEQPLGQIIGHQFDRRAGDGQKPAVGPRENPAPLAESDLDFLLARGNPDGRMPRGQEHGVIEFGENRLHDLQQGEEIDHAIDLVQRVAEFDGHAEVVAVQRLADAARQA